MTKVDREKFKIHHNILKFQDIKKLIKFQGETIIYQHISEQNPAMDIHIHGYPWIYPISWIMDTSMDIQKYPWIFRIKYFKQSSNCKMTAKLTKYSRITLQLINFDCL